MPISQQTKDQVLEVLHAFASAVSAGDMETLKQITARDAEICVPVQTFCGRDELLAARPRMQMSFMDMTVKSEGVIAWVTGKMMLDEMERSCAAVFRGTGKAWEIVVLQVS